MLRFRFRYAYRYSPNNLIKTYKQVKYDTNLFYGLIICGGKPNAINLQSIQTAPREQVMPPNTTIPTPSVERSMNYIKNNLFHMQNHI